MIYIISRDTFVVILFCVFVQLVSAQELNVMATYSQTDLIFSPGLEVNYFYNDSLGITLGFSSLLFNYKPNQLVNHIDTPNSSPDDYNSLFYNANIGLSNIIYKKKHLRIGFNLGWKVYYAPHFVPLYFYETGGYYIYFDSSGTDVITREFDHGIDIGLTLYLKKFIVGIKYDDARHEYRYLVGWSFN